jgi:hypothetical protein
VTFTRQGTTCLRATFAGRGTDGISTLTNALNQWATQMPAGSATVKGAGNRVTLTACDPGSAATEIPNKPMVSLEYLVNRDGLFAEIVKSGGSVAVATCSANDFVRDPVIAPLIESSANDPSAQLDDATIATIRSRVSQIVAKCRDSTPS